MARAAARVPAKKHKGCAEVRERERREGFKQVSNITRGRKNNLMGESGRGNSGRSRAPAPHTQLQGAEAEAEPQTLEKCSELSCSIPRGAGLTFLLPAALQRLCWLPVLRGEG